MAMPSDTTPAFLITIDTEGDDLWSRPQDITTRNTAYLPRFQHLCEEFGFKPTWLVNYEMAMDPDFIRFGRQLVRSGRAEIGMHLHAWNSPPLVPLTDNDLFHQPFLIEYPHDVMAAKIDFMTRLLSDRFECPMLSHRAGRWALDNAYARLLAQQGYLVDCSVSPGVSWQQTKGDPQGWGGADYRQFPSLPYIMDLDHIERAGQSSLLELPVSVMRSPLHRIMPLAHHLPGLRRWAWQQQPDHIWLYPDGHNLAHMTCLVNEALLTHRPCIELVLHSSELMPMGGPGARTEACIDHLYDDLSQLFTLIARAFVGMTLAEFRLCWLAAKVPAAHPFKRPAWHMNFG
jgi:hypothetical protein